jgi:hypothetical protein
VLAALVRLAGLFFLVAGALITAAGVLYWLQGWPFGLPVLLWTAAWGLGFVSLGVGMTWPRRRAAAWLGAVVGGLSLIALAVAYTLAGALVPWLALGGVFGFLGTALGASTLVLRRSPPPPPPANR